MKTLTILFFSAITYAFASPAACAPGDTIFNGSISQGQDEQDALFSCTVEGATLYSWGAFGIIEASPIPFELILGPETSGNTIEFQTNVPGGDDAQFRFIWMPPMPGVNVILDPVSNAVVTQTFIGGVSETTSYNAVANEVEFTLLSGPYVDIDVAGVSPVSNTPEPRSFIMLGSGLLFFALIKGRLRKQ